MSNTKVIRDFAAGAAIVVGIVGGIWFLAANNLAMRAVFSPANEAVRRDTFEQSKAFRDGMIQEIRAMQIEYIRAEDAVKPALASAILHKAAQIDEAALPQDLRTFVNSIKPR